MNGRLRAGSAAQEHSPQRPKEKEMLVRRFTIVCLLVTLFGMVFAILVAEASRSGHRYQTAGTGSCLLAPKILCRSVNQD
jgi:hypothetical protein